MKDNLSEVILILDKSSSMLGTRDDTLRGVNTFIEEQKALPGEANFTLVTFGTHGENTKLYKGKNIKKVKSVTKEDYKPNGNTALYDAIALTIDEMGANLAKLEEKNRPANVIITIMTDGHENDSRQFSLTQVQEKIKHQSEVYNWKFIFLGASLDAVEIGKSLGATNSFAFSDKDYSRAYAGVSSINTLYRSSKNVTAEDKAILAKVIFWKKLIESY